MRWATSIFRIAEMQAAVVLGVAHVEVGVAESVVAEPLGHGRHFVRRSDPLEYGFLNLVYAGTSGFGALVAAARKRDMMNVRH